ncbi:MAG TPA: indolepyruvate ferredoxin oxidoreductase subunit alpha [Bacteroides sp.]|nr:indolepyruvate ferredoxin oxidoreductase subunit alpha [Bacteroides sp.]
MSKLVLLGDEAIAQGALDAGLSGVYAYPGTPSTEITEYIQRSEPVRQGQVRADWTANEKTALEAALGMSYAGKRTMACMKHVGLNVAADPFMNAAVTGINGGVLVVAADDPSMHSSQNEQDSRFYGKFAGIPVLEPSSQQEAYELTRYGFDLSEKFRLPVMIRIPTRLAHSRSAVERSPVRIQNSMAMPSDPGQFVLLPALARKKYRLLLSVREKLEEEAATSGVNRLEQGKEKKRGVIACGLAYNYYREVAEKYRLDEPVLKISQYPVAPEMIKDFVGMVEEVVVLEEGYPLVEESLRGILDTGYVIRGRMDGILPRDGELNPAIVAGALDLRREKPATVSDVVKSRPPALCKGCGHADMFLALNEALAEYGPGRVFSDIGCYTLGALPPFNAINSCVDMGASVTMAKGASDAGLHPSVAVIGDSTFTHSGMTGLLDAVVDGSPVTVIISDNSATGMTGGQKSHATGRLEQICGGLGVEKQHIRVMIPLRKNHAANVKVLKEELAYEGVSVIISDRECIQTAKKKVRKG